MNLQNKFASYQPDDMDIEWIHDSNESEFFIVENIESMFVSSFPISTAPTTPLLPKSSQETNFDFLEWKSLSENSPQEYSKFCSQMFDLVEYQYETIQDLRKRVSHYENLPPEEKIWKNPSKMKNLKAFQKQQKHQRFILRMNQIFAMMKEKLEANKNLNIELEIRLGKICEQKFLPGTTAEYYEQLQKKMQSFKDWYKIHPCSNYDDYFYNLSNGTPVRTSVWFTFEKDQLNPALSIPKILPFHISKTQLHSELFCFKHELEGKDITKEFQLMNVQYDLKISVSLEDTVKPSLIPKIENNVHHVRFKQRSSFEYKPKEATMPVWKFDITKVWEGKDEKEADLKCLYGTPIYEIELELLNPYYFLFELHKDIVDCSLNALYKILDFFDHEKEYIFFEPFKN